MPIANQESNINIEICHVKFVNLIIEIKDSCKKLKSIIANLDKNIKWIKEISDKTPFNIYLKEIEEMEVEYGLCVAPILTKYHSNQCGETNTAQARADLTKKYNKVLSEENFYQKISIYTKRICDVAETILKKSQPEDTLDNLEYNMEIISNASKLSCEKVLNSKVIKDLEKIIKLRNKKFPQWVDNWKSNRKDEKCKCGSQMMIYPARSERECSGCGMIKDVVGISFEDNQVYTQEIGGNRQRNNTGQQHMRHATLWIHSILGLDGREKPPEMLADLQTLMKRDGKQPYELNYEDIRLYLSESGWSSYNNVIPSIMRELGCESPPELSPADIKEIFAKFKLIYQLFQKVKEEDDENLRYAPYFIRKICEQMFENQPEKIRIVKFMHVQSDDTLRRNDELYSKICDISEEELIYKRTIRH